MDAWNGGATTWVHREIVAGSVSHTLAAGRMLRLRVMFDHHDVWIATQPEPGIHAHRELSSRSHRC